MVDKTKESGKEADKWGGKKKQTRAGRYVQ